MCRKVKSQSLYQNLLKSLLFDIFTINIFATNISIYSYYFHIAIFINKTAKIVYFIIFMSGVKSWPLHYNLFKFLLLIYLLLVFL